MEPWHLDDQATIYHGDCLEVLRELPDASVDSVVTDPPYGLEFMGKDWDAPWRGDVRQRDDDTFKQGDRRHGLVRHGMSASYGGDSKAAMSAFGEWCELWAAECLRVLKPGGHLLAFGGTRTWHRLAVAIEDAGFEIRDSIAWMYGSGFPKSLDVSKAIDKAEGSPREVRRYIKSTTANAANMQANGQCPDCLKWKYSPDPCKCPRDDGPQTPDAARWQGWGTALKPAHEPVVVARKPLTGTVAGNVLEHGTGALNIDGCRIGTEVLTAQARGVSRIGTFENADGNVTPERTGRWPANVVLDEDQAAALDKQAGPRPSAGEYTKSLSKPPTSLGDQDKFLGSLVSRRSNAYANEVGGASRFFYVAKAPARERPKVDGVAHPTVKPLTLMRWLCRLVTPPGGVVLEPFAGSGTTIEAALMEGFRVVAIEREPDYLPLIAARLERVAQEPDDGQLTFDASA